MTIQEASSKSNVDIKELQYYEEKGLVEFKKEDFTLDIENENDEIEYISSIHMLFLMGMDISELRKLKEVEGNSPQAKNEKIKILRKYRFQLLEDIHGRQKSLDCLDYLIHKIKNR